MTLPNNPTPRTPLPTFLAQSPLYLAGRTIFRISTTLLFDFKAYGAHHIPSTGGVLIVANHQSYLDPALYACKLRRPASFMAKSELFEGNQFFAKLITAVNAFPVRQGEGDIGAVRETIRRLQEGHLLIMFPEGSRGETQEIEKLQSGIGLIIRRAGPDVRVVPAAVFGAFQAWSRYRKFPRPGPVRVKYGPALEISHLKAGEIVKVIDSKIRGLFEDLKAGKAAPWSTAGTRR